MFARIPSDLLPRRGRSLLLSALVGLSLVASCTQSEDTEPFIPASEGAIQPEGGGDRLTEDDACSRLLEAAEGARDRLGCTGAELAECPGFVRPGGGSGCYEYSERSVEACEEAYDSALTCQSLAPCVVTAQRNDELPTCEIPGTGEGGAGGAAAGGAAAGGAAAGGAPTLPEAGAPHEGGAGGASGGVGGAGG